MQTQVLTERISLDENVAIQTFKQYRLLIGLNCKKCGNSNHYWLASKNQFQCKECRFRTTIRSGTIMESCKLPLSYFFIAMNLLLETEGKLSVEELQKATHHKYYEPVWSFLHKIKSYYKLNNNAEVYANFISSQ